MARLKINMADQRYNLLGNRQQSLTLPVKQAASVSERRVPVDACTGQKGALYNPLQDKNPVQSERNPARTSATTSSSNPFYPTVLCFHLLANGQRAVFIYSKH